MLLPTTRGPYRRRQPGPTDPPASSMRDDDKMRDFLNAVYREALVRIAKVSAPQGPVIAVPTQVTPLAGPAKPR